MVLMFMVALSELCINVPGDVFQSMTHTVLGLINLKIERTVTFHGYRATK